MDFNYSDTLILFGRSPYINEIKEYVPQTFSGDETIINYVFHDKIKIVPERYNYCYKREYSERTIPLKDVAILHIPGANKSAFFNL